MELQTIVERPTTIDPDQISIIMLIREDAYKLTPEDLTERVRNFIRELSAVNE